MTQVEFKFGILEQKDMVALGLLEKELEHKNKNGKQ